MIAIPDRYGRLPDAYPPRAETLAIKNGLILVRMPETPITLPKIVIAIQAEFARSSGAKGHIIGKDLDWEPQLRKLFELMTRGLIEPEEIASWLPDEATQSFAYIGEKIEKANAPLRRRRRR